MVPTKEDKYMRLKTGNGLWVACFQGMPGHQYGEWSLVDLRKITRQSERKVVFRRQLTVTEIHHIKHLPYQLWGMKVRNQPWALVMCRPTLYGGMGGEAVSQIGRDAKESVGV